MQVNQLHDSLAHHVMGVEIKGLDLSVPLAPGTTQSLLNLLHEQQLLVFRRQDLSVDSMIRFSEQFGQIQTNHLHDSAYTQNKLSILDNQRSDNPYHGFPFDTWHADFAYMLTPPRFICFYGKKVPDRMGDTLFANMYDAYERLPIDLKNEITGKYAVFGFSDNFIKRHKEKNFTMTIPEGKSYPNQIHPVVRNHPVTNRPALSVNWLYTDRIIGYSDEESDALLKALYKHSTKPEFVYRHSYQPGDLLMWDNLSTIHTSTLNDPTYHRIMYRVMVK